MSDISFEIFGFVYAGGFFAFLVLGGVSISRQKIEDTETAMLLTGMYAMLWPITLPIIVGMWIGRQKNKEAA